MDDLTGLLLWGGSCLTWCIVKTNSPCLSSYDDVNTFRFQQALKMKPLREAGHRGPTIIYSIWKIMCFLNIKSCQHILLHQIHKIMIFKKASYDPFNKLERVPLHFSEGMKSDWCFSNRRLHPSEDTFFQDFWGLKAGVKLYPALNSIMRRSSKCAVINVSAPCSHHKMIISRILFIGKLYIKWFSIFPVVYIMHSLALWD